MRTALRIIWVSLVLIVVALTSALIAMRLAIHGREIAVPNLQGKTPAEARRLADESGLGVQVEREYYSASVPEGRVMSQAPAPGTVVRRGWEVRVALSAGPQRATIPPVVGESERAAAIAIAQRGLQLGVPASVSLPDASPGQVLAQNPPANARDASAPKISLLVEADATPTSYVMPSFIGQPLGSVIPALKDAGLSVGKVTTTIGAPAISTETLPASASASSTSNPTQSTSAATGQPGTPSAAAPEQAGPLPSSIVVSQEPVAGQKVVQGSAVNFVVR
jgi:beta-lactam-binding protein with PASTA domain